MYWSALIVFLIISFGIGHLMLLLVRQRPDYLFEQLFVKICLGLALLPLILSAFSFFSIPVDWRLLLVLSLSGIIFTLVRGFVMNPFVIRPINIRLTRYNFSILVMILIFIFSLYMNLSGAFSYPWLEGSEPWGMAESVKYVAFEKSLREPIAGIDLIPFLDPDPPGISAIFGVIHQMCPDLNWLLKFFNALMVSLCIPMFFFFATMLMSDFRKGLFSTFVLAAMPCFLSHFISSRAFIFMVLFVVIYSFEKIRLDRRWRIVAALTSSVIMLSNPLNMISLMMIVLVYFLVRSSVTKRIRKHLVLSLLFGFLFAVVLWWIPTIYTHGFGAISERGLDFSPAFREMLPEHIPLSDILFPSKANIMNAPVGVGLFVSLLVFIGLLVAVFHRKLRKEYNREWIRIALLWVLLSIIGVMGIFLPESIAVSYWSYFAFSSSLIAALGIEYLADFSSRRINIGRSLVVLVFVIGIILTSGYPKYSFNTARWMPSGFTSSSELNGYEWFLGRTPNTKVFSFSQPHKIIGYNMQFCYWCTEEREFSENAYAAYSTPNVYRFLRARDYRYVLFDASSGRMRGQNETQHFINRLGDSEYFISDHSIEGLIVFKVLQIPSP